MKTKDFIKMLQEADPSGETHVRMNGGIPYYCEGKAGYWDGPYSYIENGKYIVSTQDFKIDIYTMDIEQFVEQEYINEDPVKSTWDYIKSLFEFKLTYAIESQKQERIDGYLATVKKAYDEIHTIYEKMRIEGIDRAIENADKGWTWFQNKLVDDSTLNPNMHHYYTWKVFDENGKEQGSNLHNVEQVRNSKLFEKKDNGIMDGYYQWIKK